MTFRKRQLAFEIQLGTGVFGETGTNTIKVNGLRAHAEIVKAGGSSMGSASIRIYGLTLSLLNQLSALTQYSMVLRKNRIIVSAGDDVDGLAVIFKGDIATGWADLNVAPDGALQLSAFAGLFEKIRPVAPSSYPGQASVVDIMSDLAAKMSVEFQNNGVSVVLATPYFPGTYWEQARSCAEAANINWYFDDDALAIWPKTGSRFAQKPIIGPDTGMVGYPAYNGTGISITTLYNPKILFGQTVTVRSSIKNTNGDWVVYGLQHMLSAEDPGGEWFTHFEARPVEAGAILL